MNEMICHCFEVSRDEIEKAIREKGLKTVEEVGEATNAGTGCGGERHRVSANGEDQHPGAAVE